MTSNSGSEQRVPQGGQRSRVGLPAHDDVIRHRLIGAAVVVVVLVLVVLLAKGCAASRKERAIKDFVNQTTSILAQSNQSSRDFFALLRTPGEAGATEIETSINEQRSLASDLVRQANNLDTPDEMDLAQRYLVETLEFRRDGLEQISDQIGKALGDQDPEAATEQIAADMQNFLTSDVIYSQRSYAYMRQAVKDAEIAGLDIPTSRFLPSLDWLDPAIVEDVLSRAAGNTGSDTAVAPGLHGTGIVAVAASPSGAALTESGDNDLANAKSIAVDVQNQGENDETDVVVSLSISGAGTTIRLQETIGSIKAGETQKVTIPLTRTPAKGASGTMKIEVRRVPGEENTDNNRQSFPVSF
ncbi:MAG: hypothetical protein HZB14_09830 [Actinobacteria bacterium]|nr:hypothetical protein [Actinomycetota bacterium]